MVSNYIRCYFACLGLAVSLNSHAREPVDLPWEHEQLSMAAGLAVREGNTRLLDELLKAGLQISLPISKENGDTLLHEAVAANKPDIIRYLLGKGADPLVRNIRDERPIDELTNVLEGDLSELIAAFAHEPTAYDKQQLMEVPVPVWRGILGEAEPSKVLEPAMANAESKMLAFVSINQADPPPEMSLVLDAYYPGWLPGSCSEEFKAAKNETWGSIYRDKKTKQIGERVEITFKAMRSKEIDSQSHNYLLEKIRTLDLPCYEYRLRWTRGVLRGGGNGGFLVLLAGCWVEVGDYGFDE